MSGATRRNRRSERSAATRREILDAAWEVVRIEGLAALSMRDLGARVGMRAQSLYVYFPSKHAIYDAMFGEANHQLLSRLDAIRQDSHPVERLRDHARVFLDFCVEDPVRYQLLFQRTIPSFEPSSESYAPALEVLEKGRCALRSCGLEGQSALDLWTALTGGLAAQQNANEPRGERWVLLVDQAVDMYLHHFGKTGLRRER